MITSYIDDEVRIKKYDKREVDGEVLYVETKEWKMYKERKKIMLLMESSDLPIHARDLSFSDYVGSDTDKIDKMLKYANNFDRYKNLHLYLWSHENSTQKTTMASILGKEILLQGRSVHFILMNTLTKLLSSGTFENDENASVVKKYLDCDFLIIDDSFDRKKATIFKSGYQIPFLDEVLRPRLEILGKASCFTSNYSLEEIDESVFGTSIKKLMLRSIKDPFHFGTSYSMRNDFNPDTLWGEE
jgi:DNA replication protein DnaC